MSKTLGILGGGQLAMLLCEAAKELGVHTIVLSPDPRAPARSTCDQHLCAAYDDVEALDQLAAACDAVTLETEHLPEATLARVEQNCVLHPRAEMMRRLRDRLAQRGFLQELDVPQPRFVSIDTAEAVEQAQQSATFPGVLKTRHGGYDGIGQVRVPTAEALPAAWEKLGRKPCVMESFVDFRCEFSIVGGRSDEMGQRTYPPVLNLHRHGQLVRSEWPANLPEAAVNEGRRIWECIAAAWQGQGVIAVEFFLTQDAQVLVNEIAPRVHNSGHLTQRGANCSQFELHVRAVLGMPLPELQTQPAAMLNIYPEHAVNSEQRVQQLQEQAGGQIITYGKLPRPRRKMGHWLLDPGSLALAESLLQPTEGESAQS